MEEVEIREEKECEDGTKCVRKRMIHVMSEE
jgi:hypothetical protein